MRKFAYLTTFALFVVLTGITSCAKNDPETTWEEKDNTELHYVKSISATRDYYGAVSKSRFDITYNNNNQIATINRSTPGSSTITEESYSFTDNQIAVTIGYKTGDEPIKRGRTYLLNLNENGVIESLQLEGGTDESFWNYSYKGNRISSIRNKMHSNGLSNLQWTGENMTSGDVSIYVTDVGGNNTLETDPLTLTYSQYDNNYSVDLNTLTNIFLYPIETSLLMPRFQRITSPKLLSKYYLDSDLLYTNNVFSYEFDAKGRVLTMRVAEAPIEEEEPGYVLYEFTYYE